MTAFDAEPFSYRITKDRRVLIERGGRRVRVIAGVAAERLAGRLNGAERNEIQQILARATGNYRRGNERESHP